MGKQSATADEAATALHDRRMSHGSASSSGSAPAMVQTSRNGSRASGGHMSGGTGSSSSRRAIVGAKDAMKDDGPLPPDVLQRLQDKPPRLVYFDLETTGEVVAGGIGEWLVLVVHG